MTDRLYGSLVLSEIKQMLFSACKPLGTELDELPRSVFCLLSRAKGAPVFASCGNQDMAEWKCKLYERADPYVNDATFALSMVFLEELGATGNKVSPARTKRHWACCSSEHDFPQRRYLPQNLFHQRK